MISKTIQYYNTFLDRQYSKAKLQRIFDRAANTPTWMVIHKPRAYRKRFAAQTAANWLILDVTPVYPSIADAGLAVRDLHQAVRGDR